MLKKYLDFATWLCRLLKWGWGAGLGRGGRHLEQAERGMGCREDLWVVGHEPMPPTALLGLLRVRQQLT